MMKALFLFLLSSWLVALLPTVAQETVPAEVARLSDSLKQVYAPDSRVALFDVDYAFAKEALLDALTARGYRMMDCLELLPDTQELGEQVYGILNLSVANLRVSPDFSSEMTTQGLLGMPVRVLQCNGWYRIQTPDRYIAWVHPVAVHRVTRAELKAWNRAPKIVVTSHYGFVYSEPDEHSQPVSDIVAGNRLKWEGSKGSFYQVDGCRRHYPHGPYADGSPLSVGRHFVERGRL